VLAAVRLGSYKALDGCSQIPDQTMQDCPFVASLMARFFPPVNRWMDGRGRRRKKSCRTIKNVLVVDGGDDVFRMLGTVANHDIREQDARTAVWF
jgi:hypothetical protein